MTYTMDSILGTVTAVNKGLDLGIGRDIRLLKDRDYPALVNHLNSNKQKHFYPFEASFY